MKKIIRWVLFSFMVSFAFLFVTNKVSAESNFWDIVGDEYVINERQTDTKYLFDKSDDQYNYSFNYDYSFRTPNGQILSNGSYINYFYAITNETIINYEDLKGIWYDQINDTFALYKYNFTTREFEIDSSCAPRENSSGTCTISEYGLYKLDTLGNTSGSSKDAYLLYENNYTSLEMFGEVTVSNNDGTPKLVATVKLKDPRLVRECGEVGLSVNNITFSSECSVSEEEYGNYLLTITATIEDELLFVENGNLEINVNGNLLTEEGAINYDFVKPEVVEVAKYYNNNLPIDPFYNTYDGELVLPSEVVRAVIVIRDDSLIKEAYLTDSNKACQIESLENNRYLISCLIDRNDYNYQSLKYTIRDAYDNETVIESSNISFDLTLLPSADTLENHISFNEGNIEVNFEGDEYSDINRICIFYGEEIANNFDCGENTVEPSIYYNGNIVVLVMDRALNFATITFENVTVSHGYNEADFTFDRSVDASALVNPAFEDISDSLNQLINIACGDNEACKESIKIYAKYDDNVETLENNQLPDYLTMLNEKFRDPTCAFNKCDKNVEVILEYDIANVKQSLKMKYQYEDLLPTVTGGSLNTDDVVLEYKDFNINSSDLIVTLYGEAYEVSLKDANNESYRGVVISSFVSYTNRNGEVSAIANEGYQYIASVNNFGYYLLECKIKLLENSTSNIQYEDGVYSKSFFIRVELKDSKKPELTLKGNSEVSVQQYGVYLDDGYKCEDDSGCSVTISYYLNDENNKVDEIDTKVVGKYIIKYEAVDGDGNTTTITRTIRVISVNSLDTTSIVIIVVVVVLFVGIVTLAIVFEVKRSKRKEEDE